MTSVVLKQPGTEQNFCRGILVRKRKMDDFWRVHNCQTVLLWHYQSCGASAVALPAPSVYSSQSLTCPIWNQCNSSYYILKAFHLLKATSKGVEIIGFFIKSYISFPFTAIWCVSIVQLRSCAHGTAAVARSTTSTCTIVSPLIFLIIMF